MRSVGASHVVGAVPGGDALGIGPGAEDLLAAAPRSLGDQDRASVVISFPLRSRCASSRSIRPSQVRLRRCIHSTASSSGAARIRARARLGIARAHDQPGPLQHREVPRDRRQADGERLGELVHRRLPLGQAAEDFAPGRIGQSRKRLAQLVGRHLTTPLINVAIKYHRTPDRARQPAACAAGHRARPLGLPPARGDERVLAVGGEGQRGSVLARDRPLGVQAEVDQRPRGDRPGRRPAPLGGRRRRRSRSQAGRSPRRPPGATVSPRPSGSARSAIESPSVSTIGSPAPGSRGRACETRSGPRDARGGPRYAEVGFEQVVPRDPGPAPSRG